MSGGCWPLSESVSSLPELLLVRPCKPSVSWCGPRGHPVVPHWSCEAFLPCLRPLWGQCDVVLGMACHHPGDSVPPPQGQAGSALGTARPHTRDGMTCTGGPCSPWGWGDTPMPCSLQGRAGKCCLWRYWGHPQGRGNLWGQGCKLAPHSSRCTCWPLVTSAGAVYPTLMVFSRFPQGAPLARGCREVPRVPVWGWGTGQLPGTGAVCAAPAPRLPQGVASPGGRQQADLPNDYNCLLGADSKLICFLVQGP